MRKTAQWGKGKTGKKIRPPSKTTIGIEPSHFRSRGEDTKSFERHSSVRLTLGRPREKTAGGTITHHYNLKLDEKKKTLPTN